MAGGGPAERVAEERAEGWGGEVVGVTEGGVEDGSAGGCQERPCDGFGFGDACGGGGEEGVGARLERGVEVERTAGGEGRAGQTGEDRVIGVRGVDGDFGVIGVMVLIVAAEDGNVPVGPCFVVRRDGGAGAEGEGVAGGADADDGGSAGDGAAESGHGVSREGGAAHGDEDDGGVVECVGLKEVAGGVWRGADP